MSCMEQPFENAMPESAAVLALPGHRGGDGRTQCATAAALLEHTGATTLECDASAITRPDLDTVDVLGRLKLTASRANRSFRVTNAPASLMDLLTLTGLDEAFRATPPTRRPARDIGGATADPPPASSATKRSTTPNVAADPAEGE